MQLVFNFIKGIQFFLIITQMCNIPGNFQKMQQKYDVPEKMSVFSSLTEMPGKIGIAQLCRMFKCC